MRSLRKSAAETPSIWINSLKSIFTLHFLDNSKYGDLSDSGRGWVTRIVLTFKGNLAFYDE
jgi:hypothetical protein